MKNKIAIIAGGGTLPKLLAQCCQAQNIPYKVIAIESHISSSWVKDHPHSFHGLGQIKNILDDLESQQIYHLVFAGSIKRPSLKSLKMDALGLEWVVKIGIKAFGDDGLLKGIINLLEKRGLIVLGAQDILNSLLTPVGVLGSVSPCPEDYQDIERGIQVARLLGAADVGQAVIVEEGVVLALEGTEGTKGLLNRLKDLKKTSKGGVLVKVSKPQQELRIDLPTIGPETIEDAAKAGLKGIAVERGKSLILDQDLCIQMADKAKIFLFGIK